MWMAHLGFADSEIEMKYISLCVITGPPAFRKWIIYMTNLWGTLYKQWEDSAKWFAICGRAYNMYSSEYGLKCDENENESD